MNGLNKIKMVNNLTLETREELYKRIEAKKLEIMALRIQAKIIKELELVPLIFKWQNHPEPFRDYIKRRLV